MPGHCAGTEEILSRKKDGLRLIHPDAGMAGRQQHGRVSRPEGISWKWGS